MGGERQTRDYETSDSIHSDKHCGTLDILSSIYIRYRRLKSSLGIQVYLSVSIGNTHKLIYANVV